MKIKIQDGIFYETPKKPSKKDILYWDNPTEEQYLCSKFKPSVLDKVPADDETELIDKWKDYCKNGLWFYNKGVATYITGMHFEHLLLNKFNGTYMFYTESQRNDFYLKDLIFKSKKVNKVNITTARRYGATGMQISEILYYLNNVNEFRTVIVCKNYEYAQDEYINKLVYLFKTRPNWSLNRKIFNPTNKPIVGGFSTNVFYNSVSIVNHSANSIENIFYEFLPLFGLFDYIVCDGITDNDIIKNGSKFIKSDKSVFYNLRHEGSTIEIKGEDVINRKVPKEYSMFLPKELLPDKYGKINLRKNKTYVKEKWVA